MSVTKESVDRLMKRCQIGCGGRQALDAAHDILAECYGTLGALVQDRDALRARIDECIPHTVDPMPGTGGGFGIVTTARSLVGKRVALVPLDD